MFLHVFAVQGGGSHPTMQWVGCIHPTLQWGRGASTSLHPGSAFRRVNLGVHPRGASGRVYPGGAFRGRVHPEVGCIQKGCIWGVHPGGASIWAVDGFTPPEKCTPRKYAPEDRWSTSGRYAFYWNAFLFSSNLHNFLKWYRYTHGKSFKLSWPVQK